MSYIFIVILYVIKFEQSLQGLDVNDFEFVNRVRRCK